MNDTATKNIAETLGQILPKAATLSTIDTGTPGLFISHVALPRDTSVKELVTDIEKHLPNPRRTTAHASLADTDSFLEYVAIHALANTAVWCDFNPQTFKLKFTAVIDEHAQSLPGWRAHTATLEPLMSAEWKAWKGQDKQAMAQLAFAEWIEEHDTDIAAKEGDGMPSSLKMLGMAREFVHNEDRVLKSSVRQESGGTRLTYIADADAGTTETMSVFNKFALGIPVFHGASPWAIQARLKYRVQAGKVNFHYELVRADRVHEAAAQELVDEVRAGLAHVPLLMGACC